MKPATTRLPRAVPQRLSTTLPDTALIASRRLWLAGLGAAALTREWLRSDAQRAFDTLVREGCSVERNARGALGGGLRYVNAAWRETERAARSGVKAASERAALFLRANVPDPIRGWTAVDAPAPRKPARARGTAPNEGRRARESAREGSARGRPPAKKRAR